MGQSERSFWWCPECEDRHATDYDCRRDPLWSLTKAELVAKVRTADVMYRAARTRIRELESREAER